MKYKKENLTLKKLVVNQKQNKYLNIGRESVEYCPILIVQIFYCVLIITYMIMFPIIANIHIILVHVLDII